MQNRILEKEKSFLRNSTMIIQLKKKKKFFMRFTSDFFFLFTFESFNFPDSIVAQF